MLRAMLGAMLCVTLLIATAGTGVYAEDDDDVEWDTKIFRDFLKNLGLRKDDASIDYRERSPLVVPQNLKLVPPVSNQTAEKNPAWPKDPDVQQQKQSKVKRRAPTIVGDRVIEEGRPLRPDELRYPGASTKSSGQTDVAVSNPDGQVLKPSELGYKGGLFSSIFASKGEEYTTFTGEPPRTSLIEPPPGYRTPSPFQPYGVGREKAKYGTVDKMEPVH